MADPKMRFDTIVKNLRENNHKLTPQRLAIVKILSRSEGHPRMIFLR
jgi:Fur family peroxide stress response transcriptional regulator